MLEPRSNTLRRKVLQSDLVASLRLADRVVLAGVYQQQRIAEDERLHPEDVVHALNAPGHAGCALPRCGIDSWTRSFPNCEPETWWPFFPMAASTESMRSFRRASRPRPVAKARMIASLTLLATIVILGAPAALIFIPWAMLTGNATPLYNVSQAIVRTAYRLAGIRVEVEGLEHIPAHTACIFMANHVSNLDPPALFPRIPGRTSAFVKRSLTKIPVFGYGLKLGDFVPVDRDGRVESAVGKRGGGAARAGERAAHHHVC